MAFATGCKSAPPTQYFTVSMDRAAQAPPALNVTVDRFRASEALARPQILIKKSPTQVDYYLAQEWAAGVDELVEQKLRAELGAPREGLREIVVAGEVLSFEQVDVAGGAEAHLKLLVQFRENAGSRYDQALLEKTYDMRKPAASATAAAVVEALSAALEDAAAEIARDAATL